MSWKKYVGMCIQNRCMASCVFRIKYRGLYIQKNIAYMEDYVVKKSM
jgi:hypothetical protein